MTVPVSIVRTASTLPTAVVSNVEIGERLIAGVQMHDEDAEEIVAKVRERSELIEKKTGLRARRFFDPAVSPVAVGLELLERLVGADGWGRLDALIVSSSSTHGFPGLSQQIVAAARAQHPELGHPFVLDIGSNACTSFMYGLAVGTSTLQTMGFRSVACLAIEFASRCIAYDPLHFGTSTLFGDAAAGLLLRREGPAIATVEAVRASSLIEADTIGLIKGGGMAAAAPGADVPSAIRWYMAGPPVGVGATRILIEEIRRHQATGARIDWLIPHQANLTRILIPACEKTGIDPAKLCASFAETGNTSSASIPLLLDQLVASGNARAGDVALLVGFGSSYTVGSALLRFC
ncbi:MAG: 3-oxoacyl-[acyl-carrier-protein] synthase III C-terminal domain-containing protein [Burkholderiales bacterium]